MGELPTAPIVRIFRRNAGDIRITEEAMQLLINAIEEEGKRISRKAVELAQEEGRKTIQSKDIRKWRTLEETEGNDFVYIRNNRVWYNMDTNTGRWTTNEDVKTLDVKFLDGVLLFDNRLYRAGSISEARRIMESHVPEILDSLMQPHWAYNIYEYRAWEDPEKINDRTTRLSMWFDDYDGGDVIVEGYIFNKP